MPSIRQSIRSSTASKRPTSAIADGQIALNTASGTPGIFFKDSAGNIVKAGPAHYGATAPNSSPAVGGSTGNSFGEAWLDISLTPAGWKIWNGSAWVNATPLSSDTVQGLVELATNAETQAGVDAARAVTAASLQSKVSDSISTTSASGIASSTAVKTAYDLANAALPKSGGIVTGNLEIGSTGSFTFEGATADGFETTLAVVDPTADRTITFPNITGTVVTTGDTGTVTSTMILDGTILNADINASAAIVDTKLATIATALKVSNSATTAASTNTASAIVARDASGNFIAGTITAALTGAASSNVLKAGDTMTGALIVPSGTVTANGIQVGTGTTYKPGIYSPGTDQLAISTGGTSRIVFDASGNVNIDSNTFYVDAANNRVGLGTTGPTESLHTTGALRVTGVQTTAGTGIYLDQTSGVGNVSVYGPDASTQGTFRVYTATSNGGTGSVKLTVDSSGRVGIGTTGPANALQVVSGSNYVASFNTSTISASSSAVVIGNYLNNGGGASGGAIRVYHNHGAGTATSMAFEVNGATEAIRIDDQRRLLVGTSSTSGNGCLIQSRNDSTGLALELQRSSDNASAAALFLTKSRGTQGSPTEVSNGDQLGVIAFSGHDGAGYKDAAYIIAEADGTWTDGGDTTDNPGRLVFSTTADGAASPTERMRITNAGNILINTTSTYSASVCTTDFNSASQFGLTLRDTGSATDAVMMYFYKSGNVRGNITTTATATAFNTSSDYRLKRDVVPIENASSRVQQLRPVNFAWEETGSRCDGFLAHEAQAVVPECVTGEKDAVDEDGNPVYQGIDQSKLVPLLTAALQEAIAKIEALETRLSALEAA